MISSFLLVLFLSNIAFDRVVLKHQLGRFFVVFFLRLLLQSFRILVVCMDG